MTLALLLPALPVAADPGFGRLDLRQDYAPVQVSAPRRAADLSAYASYYAALVRYSNLAYESEPGSPAFLAARSRGIYLRSKAEEHAGETLRWAASDPCAVWSAVGETGRAALPELLPRLPVAACPGLGARKSAAPAAPSGVSPAVAAELQALFGGSGDAKGAEEDVVIKEGYCYIRMVQGGVPYLVQRDGFLKKGEVIMTFDDGPSSSTYLVSNSMKEAEAPSIFFVLGRNLVSRDGKSQVRTQASGGHAVAVHGYNHATERDKPFSHYPTETTVSQLSLVTESIKTITGVKPAYFRPPYGIIPADALRAVISDLDLVPVGWTIDTLDWSTKDPEELFSKVTAQVQKRGKGIILMHDIHPQSREAAARLGVWLKDNGYKVVPPSRLIKAFKGQ